ncbi:MAG: hypothetical protein Q4G25_06550 [Paracoccus sp. (in: a-proteobacteria)]|nr:hypothetical protein [Paracoccus sp. (in: a-proteobacteria)]
MDKTHQFSARESLNKAELARHLGVERSGLARILVDTGLTDVAGRYPSRRFIRFIHRTEAAWLHEHLVQLKRKHNSPILDCITDLQAELMKPLMSFDEMARALGRLPDTLSRALREGRTTLPFPEIRLGPRLRRYRPIEVTLWRDEGILLDLPAVMMTGEKRGEAIAEGPERTPGNAASDCPAGTPQKALFGVFARHNGKVVGQSE